MDAIILLEKTLNSLPKLRENLLSFGSNIDYIPKVLDSEIYVVLIFPLEVSLKIREKSCVQLVDDEIDKIVAHCFLNWRKNVNICEICDVHLHSQKGLGLGSKMFKVIMYSLSINFPYNTTLWLGVKLDNPFFSRAVNIYTKNGFRNPKLSTKNVFGVESFGDIISFFNNNQLQTNEKIKETYLLTHILAGKIEEFTIYFSKSCLEKLSKFPYSFGVLEDGKMSHKEAFGTFNLTLCDDLWEVTPNYEIKLGTEESVSSEFSEFSFHTHPYETYEKMGVNVGTPSGDDIFHFIEQAAFGFAIFHCVVSVEGVYVLYFPKGFSRKSILERASKFSRLNLDFKKERSKNTSEFIRRFFEFINTIRDEKGPLINCDLITEPKRLKIYSLK